MANEVCPVATCYYSIDKTSFQIPNGIISRWPITSSGYWDDPNLSNRELAWAIIDIPGAKDILAVSVHLHTSPPSDQVAAAKVVSEEIYNHRVANPNGYYYVVGGDFNGSAAVSNSGFGQWNGSDVFYVSGPHPKGEDGKEGTNASRSKHYDYVLADHPLQAFQVPVVYHSTTDSSTMTYTDGLVFDTRNFTQSELNEFFPGTTTGDSGASQMQHMAIVKDFYIH
jgi:endonuclease/exonuclease/phosphatase family metal-dependent hydrolase